MSNMCRKIFNLFQICGKKVEERWNHHGAYIRWLLTNRCARKEQYPLFDLVKAFDLIENSYNSPKRPIILDARATCSELPSNISTPVGIIAVLVRPGWNVRIRNLSNTEHSFVKYREE